EAWAIHGLYPQYTWMPDSKSVVIWGEGKIWRVDVASGESTAVPFVAHVEQTLNEALRFPQKVYTPEFPVKMLRDVATSPDGKQVAYSALGHLYVKSLPDGAPKRVTGVSDRFEFDPAWSTDGQWLAYTTWSDADYGRVRVIKTDGSGGRDVFDKPGHYIEASFSPDGRINVYRAAAPDTDRGKLYGSEPGIYVVPTDGSAAPRLVRESGSDPMFDHTGKRIYVTDSRNNKFVLASVGIADPPHPPGGRAAG